MPTGSAVTFYAAIRNGSREKGEKGPHELQLLIQTGTAHIEFFSFWRSGLDPCPRCVLRAEEARSEGSKVPDYDKSVEWDGTFCKWEQKSVCYWLVTSF